MHVQKLKLYSPVNKLMTMKEDYLLSWTAEACEKRF